MSSECLSTVRSFGGEQYRFQHCSEVLNCDMIYAVYVPPQAAKGPVPAVYYLSGLTCTDENFVTKAGAQQYAAALGVAVVAPDTSPRGDKVADDPDGSYDMGLGAGFYLNATEAPWSAHYHMYDYVLTELPEVVAQACPQVDTSRAAIMGHSMGGHGALTIAMNFPDRFASVSAFSPICNPMESDWGRKQLGAYLGDNTALWEAHDATMLMRAHGFPGPILIDTGTADQFGDLLKTEALAEAMAAKRQQGSFRMQPGYDHSYYFIATFIEAHIAHHASFLKA